MLHFNKKSTKKFLVRRQKYDINIHFVTAEY